MIIVFFLEAFGARFPALAVSLEEEAEDVELVDAIDCITFSRLDKTDV